MDDVKRIWSRILQRTFFPEERRWLVWISIGPIAILLTALTLLARHQPLHAFLIGVGIASLLVFWKATLRVSVVFIVSLTLFASYSIFTKPTLNGSLDFLWVASLSLSLVIALLTISEGKRYFHEFFVVSERTLSDRNLWEARFHTLKEKKDSDNELWEKEVEGVKFELEERCAYIESLKRLVSEIQNELTVKEEALVESLAKEPLEKVVANLLEIEGRVIDQEELNRIVRELNESRTEHYQTKVLLEDAERRLLELEEVDKAKRKRNQTLLAAKSQGSISLKELAKGLPKG